MHRYQTYFFLCFMFALSAVFFSNQTASFAVAGCNNPPAVSGPPTNFKFSRFAGLVGASQSVVWDTGLQRLVMTDSTNDGPAGTQQIAPMTTEQWSTFWQKANELGVWTWQGRYDHLEVADGTAWDLSIRNGDCTAEAGGSNGYPPNNVGPDPSNEWQQFRDLAFSLVPANTSALFPSIEKPANTVTQHRGGKLGGKLSGFTQLENNQFRIRLSVVRSVTKKNTTTSCEALNQAGHFRKYPSQTDSGCIAKYALSVTTSPDKNTWSLQLKHKLQPGCYAASIRATFTSTNLKTLSAETSFCVKR